MKKLLLFLALISIGSLRVLADGTITFQNDTLSGPFYTNGTSGPGKVGTAAGLMMYGLFYSDATLGGTSNNLTFLTAVGNSTASFGVIQGNVFQPLPGTNPGDQAWIMILAWDGALGPTGYTHYVGPYGSGPAGAASSQWDGSGKWFLQTRTILVALGSSAGPGPNIFHIPGDASHIGGIPDETIFAVPEPSSLGLLISGGLATYLFRRKKS
jgi:PEP-CTERM motif